MKIWCLFSIENEYNQPSNNLIAWWNEKPSQVKLQHIMLESNVNKLLNGYTVRYGNIDFRLEEVKEGVALKYNE
jgi:hypothetical protein